ncbi:hypothetical protein [Conexibacter woesei]|uniref:Uncharacterized protein n=1 Tax=Conexibacter woesei (strain DSM 14684 / CCUG 47730 / CIP 108061 / JCM 11494 / NBRC 100937 / ID131577) TaxID=469383 RepID=D3EYZ8_CONWI|nr:hypothetical protein [Conexibacter woesei]ADB49872.1 hypothetical protein Cwoe_1444 [Conexibacter woesei DSM 14684]
MAVQPVQIRSFRVCFRLERRIHKIDRWRIPLPFGVPLRGLGYAAVALFAILFAARLPLVGDVLGLLPAPFRYAILPAGIAYALTRWEIDGRAAHAAGLALLRMRLEPARLSAFRPVAPLGQVSFDDVSVASDARGARLRRAEVVGPARMIVRYPVRARERRGRLVLERGAGDALWRGTEITLQPGQRAVLR